jgi:hypothetical protein
VQPGATTLGDILAAVFAVEPAPVCPGLCEVTAGKALCTAAAAHYGVDWAEAWDALCSVPDADLGGLKTASGWTALAATIAKDLGASGDPLLPYVH